MKLINKDSYYIVENSNEHLKFKGTAEYDEQFMILHLAGEFFNYLDEYLGNCSCAYHGTNKIDKHIVQVDKDILHSAETLLDTTLDLLINDFKFYDNE